MKEKLQTLLKNSYSPYSNFKVASIVEMKDGTYFSGINVENASYGATICAERVAITSAVAKGYRKGDFKGIYVMVDSPKISTCCFLCRQLLVEFFEPDCFVICMNQNGEQKEFRVEEMCPSPFDQGDLE